LTHLYLIRHCEAESNRYRRCCGQYDTPVTENGLRQISALADRFAAIPLAAVYSSDLCRARRTAAPLADRRGIPVVLVSGLREMHMGNWENQAWGNISMFDPAGRHQFLKAAHKLDLRPSGGESVWGVARRMRDTLTMLAETHPGQTIAAATHGTALRAFLSEAMEKPREQLSYQPLCPNTGFSSLFYENGRFEVEYYNDGTHLHERYRPVRPGDEMTSFAMGEELWFWFRPASEEDVRFVRPVFKQEGIRPSPGLRVHVGVMNGRPGGFFILDDTLPGDAAELCYLWVAPELRGKRLALQLLGEACAVTGLRGKPAVLVRTERCNQRTASFLMENGFVSDGGCWKKAVFASSII